jgi:hypothetical protein
MSPRKKHKVDQSESLKELKQILQEDVEETRPGKGFLALSKAEKFRILIRLSISIFLTVVLYLFNVIYNIKMLLTAIALFIVVEFIRVVYITKRIPPSD